jgi:hypothetical protein
MCSGPPAACVAGDALCSRLPCRPDRPDHASLATNLPVVSSSFVGRIADLDAIAERFEDGAQLVTITGLGGMGKTRLAQRFADAQVAGYVTPEGGGVWF